MMKGNVGGISVMWKHVDMEARNVEDKVIWRQGYVEARLSGGKVMWWQG